VAPTGIPDPSAGALFPAAQAIKPRRWRRSRGWCYRVARHGGRREASGAALFASRWVRISLAWYSADASAMLMITTMEPFRDHLNGATSGSA